MITIELADTTRADLSSLVENRKSFQVKHSDRELVRMDCYTEQPEDGCEVMGWRITFNWHNISADLVPVLTEALPEGWLTVPAEQAA